MTYYFNFQVLDDGTQYQIPFVMPSNFSVVSIASIGDSNAVSQVSIQDNIVSAVSGAINQQVYGDTNLRQFSNGNSQVVIQTTNTTGANTNVQLAVEGYPVAGQTISTIGIPNTQPIQIDWTTPGMFGVAFLFFVAVAFPIWFFKK